MATPDAPRSLVLPAVLGSLAAVGVGGGVSLLMLSSAKLANARAIGEVITARHGGCVAALSNYDAWCPELQAALKADNALHNGAVSALVMSGVMVAGAVSYLLWPARRTEVTQSATSNTRLAPILDSTSCGVLLEGSF